MSQTSFIDGRARGAHVGGISFSLYSIPHVPTALVHDGSAFLETRSLHARPERALDFVKRTCKSKMMPFREATRWGESLFNIERRSFNFTVPRIVGHETNQISFRMQAYCPNGNSEPEISLKAEIEYRSPAFYLFQLAEFELIKTDEDPIVNGGVAATLIAGNAALFGYNNIANRYGILRHGAIKVEDATTLANGVENEDMSLVMTPGGCAYQSASRGYGFGCDGLPSDNAPDVSIKFSDQDSNILSLNGEKLPLTGPSIAVLQNSSIAAYELHDNVIPIVKDLVLAAAYMYPSLPLRHSI